MAIKEWLKQKENYDFRCTIDPTKPCLADNTQYYTQMVWKSTTKIGVGISGRFVVARFCEQRGNIVGQFRDNVIPLGGRKDCNEFEKMKADGSCEECPSYQRA